jgi:hypothetical protein
MGGERDLHEYYILWVGDLLFTLYVHIAPHALLPYTGLPLALCFRPRTGPLLVLSNADRQYRKSTALT